ncbi:hypothetical protein [Streptomyces sp. NPDC088360]|uniref:hypothetical protein n=1 Tax=Streptomyces sp. NPDC088360 TaxID=3154515 RepID=UPI00344D3619
MMGDLGTGLGEMLLFVLCVTFLTVLAAASVLLLSGADAIVHDLGRGDYRRGAGRTAGDQHGRAAPRDGGPGRPITAAAPQRCVYGTLTPIIVLTSSPALSGAPDSLFPEADWSLWPLYPPVIVSASASFLLARSRHTDGPNRPTASPSEGRAG